MGSGSPRPGAGGLGSSDSLLLSCRCLPLAVSSLADTDAFHPALPPSRAWSPREGPTLVASSPLQGPITWGQLGLPHMNLGDTDLIAPSSLIPVNAMALVNFWVSPRRQATHILSAHLGKRHDCTHPPTIMQVRSGCASLPRTTPRSPDSMALSVGLSPAPQTWSWAPSHPKHSQLGSWYSNPMAPGHSMHLAHPRLSGAHGHTERTGSTLTPPWTDTAAPSRLFSADSQAPHSAPRSL